MPDSASLIICTADRAESLRETLSAVADVQVPAGMEFELIVVDNAPSAVPTEQSVTENVVDRAARCVPFPIRYVPETNRGLSRARNRGVAAACGAILLMTDDDIRPATDWLVRMTAPILTGAADAVAGGVRLAPNLHRPWMTGGHMGLMASTEWIAPDKPVYAMIGANMAFHRRLLEKVPSFDVELGAGTPYGGGEEVLFSYQFIEAGYRFQSRIDVMVEHHTDESRLSRAALASRMAKAGREMAYIRYHWEQDPVGQAKRNAVRSFIEMWQAERAAKRSWPHSEGLPEEELTIIHKHYFYRQYLIERRRPRNYDRRGLVKKHGILADAAPDNGEAQARADRH